jgi:hypothetical protein
MQVKSKMLLETIRETEKPPLQKHRLKTGKVLVIEINKVNLLNDVSHKNYRKLSNCNISN